MGNTGEKVNDNNNRNIVNNNYNNDKNNENSNKNNENSNKNNINNNNQHPLTKTTTTTIIRFSNITTT